MIKNIAIQFDKLVKFANDNQGFMMVILTAVYVLTTLGLLFENRRLRKEQHRPKLVAHFLQKGGYVYFAIEEILSYSSAIDVSLYIEPKIHQIQNPLKVSVISPRSKISYLIGDVKNFSDKKEYKFKISLTYKNTFGEKFVEKEMLDLDVVLQSIEVS